jgi:predicted ATPase
MLVNYRPEFTHTWGNKTYYTQLRLNPLGKESGEEMLKALLGDGRDLVALKRVIIEKTEGNPFFMEEIVQALFEQRALLRNGSIKLAKSLSTIQIPATVQAVLASRIDRLSPAQKRPPANPRGDRQGILIQAGAGSVRKGRRRVAAAALGVAGCRVHL